MSEAKSACRPARAKRRGEKIAVSPPTTPPWRVSRPRRVDVLLVGDSVGVVVLGYEHTLPVTLDDMAAPHARRAPRRRRVLVVRHAVHDLSGRVESACASGTPAAAGAAAVKVEGRLPIVRRVRRMVESASR
jgi:3-methyl-2-oxobutanoate hydroxymethyltransferase